MSESLESLSIALFGELLMADQLARNRLAKALPKGMELSHFTVLNHLAGAGGEKTPAQLARAFHVTRGAMSNTLARLEWAGYVHIRPDWDDARRKWVAISPAGRRAREAALATISPLLTEVVMAVGPYRVRAALPVLREVRMRLEAEAEGDTPGATPGATAARAALARGAGREDDGGDEPAAGRARERVVAEATDAPDATDAPEGAPLGPGAGPGVRRGGGRR